MSTYGSTSDDMLEVAGYATDNMADEVDFARSTIQSDKQMFADFIDDRNSDTVSAAAWTASLAPSDSEPGVFARQYTNMMSGDLGQFETIFGGATTTRTAISTKQIEITNLKNQRGLKKTQLAGTQLSSTKQTLQAEIKELDRRIQVAEMELGNLESQKNIERVSGAIETGLSIYKQTQDAKEAKRQAKLEEMRLNVELEKARGTARAAEINAQLSQARMQSSALDDKLAQLQMQKPAGGFQLDQKMLMMLGGGALLLVLLLKR